MIYPFGVCAGTLFTSLDLVYSLVFLALFPAMPFLAWNLEHPLCPIDWIPTGWLSCDQGPTLSPQQVLAKTQRSD